MRKMLLIVLLPLVVFARQIKPQVAYAIGHGALAKICVKVCDDFGLPVSNANVNVIFDMIPIPSSVYCNTDVNGICIVEGKTNGNSIRMLVGKDGYYGSEKKISYIVMGKEHDVMDGKWQPYGAMEVIVLRRIHNPVAHKIGDGKFAYSRHLNQWIGFDMEKHDYIFPYGEGNVADFEVLIDWDGEWLPKYTGMGVHIRFAEPYSGYYEVPVNSVSKFKGPYFAERDKFVLTTAVFDEIITNSARRISHLFDEGKCWVVRSRCKVDKSGKLMSANYSVVYKIEFCAKCGGIGGVRVKGALNLTPNDVNIEDGDEVKNSQFFLRHCCPPI